LLDRLFFFVAFSHFFFDELLNRFFLFNLVILACLLLFFNLWELDADGLSGLLREE